MPLDVRVKVFVGNGNGEGCYGRGHDLSRGGMAIYVPRDLKIGQEVGLEFELPHSRMRFGVRCVVRNSEGYRYGIEFLQLAGTELAELKQALERAMLLHDLTSGGALRIR